MPRYIELKKIGLDETVAQPLIDRLDKIQKDLRGRSAGNKAENSGALLEEADQINAQLQALRDEHGPALDYRKQLVALVGAAPAQGANVAMIGQRIKIMDKIEAAGDVVILDKDEYDIVRTLVCDHKWPAVERNILTFAEDIKAAPENDPRGEPAAEVAAAAE